MKNKILFISVLSLFLIFSNASASDICSSKGYTIFTINGIFTDDQDAIKNKNILQNLLPVTYNNEKVIVDYLYNPTHLAGVGDLVDVVNQGFFDQKSDYDLVEMLNSASEKVTTEKLLLVGYSQGNFYTNNFYDKVANIDGGVPSESIGTYGIATPADHVAGDGKYLTSDTDSIIALVIGRVKNIMKPNTHIDLQKADGDGHDFSNVYLKYRSDKIISDIKSSLGNLKTNQIQDSQNLCITPQKISIAHKIGGAVITAADFVVDKIVSVFKSLENTVVNLSNKSLALVGFTNDASTVSSRESISDNTGTETPNEISSQEQIQSDVPIENTDIPSNDQTPIPEILNDTENQNPTTDTPIATGGRITSNGNSGGGNNNGGGGENNTTNSESSASTDTVAPVITLIGESTVTISQGTIYADAGATALDDVDGVITVETTSTVDTATIGTYTITYQAKDKAQNIATLTRTVNVISNEVAQNPPATSPTAILSLPTIGSFAGDGIDPSRGRKNLTQFVFQVIYTDSENNPPQNIKLHIRNTTTGVSLPDIEMNKIIQDTDILSDGNYANGEIYTASSTYDQGEYAYSFTAFDKNGSATNKIEDDLNLRFTVVPSNYTYIPKYSFGINNGDGNDWQVWAFNGSNIYDWSDTYVNNYLREQFKIQTYGREYWCSSCMQIGIFNHDPQKGFETTDVTLSSLDYDPQNIDGDITYDVIIQWDSSGYTTTIYNGTNVYKTSHTDVVNMNNNLWVGWDDSYNNFTKFPSGVWIGVPYKSPVDRTGGNGMVLQPYPVYNSNPTTPVINPIPNPNPNPVLSSEKLINSFSFEGLSPVVNGVIDNTGHTINLTVPYGTQVANLIPTIKTSEKSSITPGDTTVQDFINPITYTVTAEDGTTSSYVVTVIVSANPNPVVPDSVLPTLTSHSFNGVQSNIIINPLINNLSIVLNANKNVNWMTIKIEKEDDDGVYKIFHSGDGCEDGTSTCTKIWDGLLSKGGLLQSGNYKVKVHMQDAVKNDYEDYLPSIITVNTQ